MVPVRVKGVAMPSEDSLPVVVLSGKFGSIAVSVGAYEASAIIMQLEGLSTPRPQTHQLLAELFREQRLSLRRAELYGVYGYEEDGFLARIVYGRGLSRRIRDVRPSDAITLALATGAPLYAHPSLFSQSACTSSSEITMVDADITYWHGQSVGA